MRGAVEGREAVSVRSAGKNAKVSVSVIVTVTERPATLVELYEEYAQPLREGGYSFEFVFVAEPWNREFTAPVAELAAAGEPVRAYEAGQVVGESALLRLAAAESRGEILLTLPAYYRVEASTLPGLIDAVRRGADLALARRWPRRDSWINRLQTRAFHSLIAGLAEGKVHDVACGVRAMRRDIIDAVPLYGDFFRFLPLFALRQGYRVEEIAGSQHPKDVPTRVYRPGVYLRRLIDVLGLFFLLRFTEKPLRFFGLVGSSFALAGAAILAVLAIQRIGGQAIANRPLLLLGVLLLVLGFQAIALGLIGEIIVHLRAAQRPPYRLKTTRGETSEQ
jgi:hypothetical protein